MSNSKLFIRKMGEQDLQAVVALSLESGLASWNLSDYTRELSDPNMIMLVADFEGSLVGFFSGRMIMAEFELFSLAVLLQFRRQGIGQQLLHDGLALIKRSGALGCFLEVRRANIAARSLYAANGFKEIGIRRNYYHNPDDDAVMMTLPMIV